MASMWGLVGAPVVDVEVEGAVEVEELGVADRVVEAVDMADAVELGALGASEVMLLVSPFSPDLTTSSTSSRSFSS